MIWLRHVRKWIRPEFGYFRNQANLLYRPLNVINELSYGWE